VKHELGPHELGASIQNVDSGHYGSFSGGQVSGRYLTGNQPSSDRFNNGFSAGSQFSGGQTAGSQFTGGFSANTGFGGSATGSVNYVRMPDGTYRANGPSVANDGRVRVEHNTPKFSGNAMQFVESDPPVPIDGDIENLLPRELHAKAYGRELHRKGPLNGAQDSQHIF
jgi:hypothetical protein